MYLIPQLENLLDNYFKDNYEILVVDDNSTDNTLTILKNFKKINKNINFIIRKKTNSLPKSILDGIKFSKYKYVMWLDADGSMDIDSVERLITSFIKDSNNIYIGSRFVDGGGYKGYEENKNISSTIYKLFNSEDSFLAVILSLMFNKLLKSLLRTEISDLTSGFIIINRDYLKDYIFEISEYGDYFIYLVDLISKNKLEITEVGYYCKPRKYGYSKTSTNMFRLISLSYPYILAAFKCRFGKFDENIR